MTRVPVKPELIRWARERSCLDYHSLATRFPKLSEWEDGEQQPTLKGEVLELLGIQVGVHPLVGCETGSAMPAQAEGAPHGEETTGIDADP